MPPSDAADVVQSVLADALVAETAPDDAESLRKWLFGMARNKIADFYRRRRREPPAPESIDPAAPSSGRAAATDLLRWAEKELPPGSEARRTFEWMLREGEGEKLEAIAESEKLPAPRVRKRVSRLRAHFRSRWAATFAALVATGLAIVIAVWVLRRKPVPEARITPESPFELAHQERQRALESCDRGEWQICLDGLDHAAASDPAGDRDPRVTAAREAARKALTPPPPPPPPTASVVPTPTVTSTVPRRPVPTSTATPLRSTPGSSM